MDYNPITEGLIKAMKFIAESATRQARSVRPKYEYEKYGQAVHFEKCLTSAERQPVLEIFAKVAKTTDRKEIEALYRSLLHHPVKFVPIQRATSIERSRYSGEELRRIRAEGGGAKEKARAARRATSHLMAAQ